MLRELIQYYSVDMLTSTKLKEVTREGAVVETCDGNIKLIKADTIIIAVGYDSYAPLVDDIKGSNIEVHLIGDAREVGNLLSVVRDAYEVGFSI